jgi:phosphate transport system permease protein
MTTKLATEPSPQKGPSAPDPHWATGKLPSYVPWAIVGGAVVVAAILVAALGMSIAGGVAIAWVLLIVALVGASRAVEGGRKSKDRLATSLVCSSFGLALVPLGTLLWEVVSKGAPSINGTFLTYSMRNVVGEGGGIYHALMGTLIITALTALMSVPIGLLAAIYLVEYGTGSRLARSITFLVDVMTGIPSIVAGLFAFALFRIFFGPGVRMGFAGAVALSLLMIPLVVRSCEEMLKLVPNELREAAYALGVSKWRTIVKVVVPTALAGIVTGVTIATARIIGETAPLLIIAGATTSTNLNPFSDRMMTLPVFIFTSFRNPGVPPEPSYDRAWGAALVLVVIIMLLNLVARLISYAFSPKTKQ